MLKPGEGERKIVCAVGDVSWRDTRVYIHRDLQNLNEAIVKHSTCYMMITGAAGIMFPESRR